MSPNWREETRQIVRDVSYAWQVGAHATAEAHFQKLTTLIQSIIDRAESFRLQAAKAERGAQMERNARMDFEARCRRLEKGHGSA